MVAGELNRTTDRLILKRKLKHEKILRRSATTQNIQETATQALKTIPKQNFQQRCQQRHLEARWNSCTALGMFAKQISLITV